MQIHLNCGNNSTSSPAVDAVQLNNSREGIILTDYVG
jgi:hypothetical protein